jgi:hypothetical protein
MQRMITSMRDIIDTHMLQKKHMVISFTKYKENSRLVVKVCDFIDLFSSVNQKIIIKDTEKVKVRRSKVSDLFRETSESLSVIEKLIREIRLVSIKHAEESQQRGGDDLVFHTIWSYYYGLGEYERSANDTPTNPQQPNPLSTSMSNERMMPVVH